MAFLFPCLKKSEEDAADSTEVKVKVKPKKESQPEPRYTLVSVGAPRVVNTVTVETQTAEDEPTKSQPVLRDTEHNLMCDLGLGRGVDGTNPTPWLKRTAFQVRRVTGSPSRIVGTDEGGTLQKYVREVTNVRSQRSTLKASIEVPKAPLLIGVDAEYSRTFTKSRKSVGIRIHNRTVSFASDFDEASDWMFRDLVSPKKGEIEYCIRPKAVGDIPKPDAKEEKSKAAEISLTFEERMCTWILEHEPEYEEYKKKKVPKNPGEDVEEEAEEVGGEEDGDRGAEELLAEKSQSPIVKEFTQFFKKFKYEEFRKRVDSHCKKFVNFFRITHYVSAIQLGAVKYDMLEQEEYEQEFGSSTHVAVEKVGELDFSTNLKWKRLVKDTTLSKIGIMRKDPISKGMVVRRSDEAVIGAEIKPLTRLVRHPLLHKSLQKALKDYMDEVQDDQEGPFYITCDDDRLFLKVSTPPDIERGAKKNVVLGVRSWQEASKFFIIPTYDSKHPHEFAIAYYTKKEDREEGYRDVKPIPRYLNASTDLLGRNDGPLKMEFGVTEHNCRFTLRNRLSLSYEPGDITPWVVGQEGFYLHCARRCMRRNGYVCVKQDTKDQLITACVKSRKEHNEDENVFMVFRLVQPEQFPRKKEEGRKGELRAVEKVAMASGLPHKGASPGKKTVVTAQIEDTPC